MKTRRILLFALTLLQSVVGIQSAMAQASQDALYIFRNDGQFNAFFFGDIDHIEYSKVDTLGVEQADYVVQEVYALDSVFRIPVSAIDSVAFTTPETKIKPDVFCPDKSIADYIVASDSVYWIRLATNTPAALIPKVGDKLLIEDESQFIPDGFGGLVTAVTEGSDGITVMTSALALTEVYEQLYVKLAGASPDMQPVQTSRRGPLEGVDITVPEEEIVIPTVSQTITLKKSQALLPDNSYVELNGEVQGSMSLTVSTKMRLRAFLTITPFTGFRYYQETFLDTETESALALTGGLSGRLEVPFIPAPIHTIKKGQLKVEVGVGLFLEAQATALSLTLKNSKSERTRVNVTLEDDDINLVPPVFNPYYRWSSYCEKDTTEIDFQFMGQYSVGLGAFAKAEAKLSIPIEKTPKFVQAWTKTDSLGFKATLGLDIGTKLEYAGPIVTSVPTDLMQTIPLYKELNKGNVSLSAYFKFVASLSLCNWTAEYAPEVKFWEPINRGLVPNITSIKVSQDKEQPIRPYRLLLSSTTEDRHILLGTKVGFAVLDANQKVEKDSLCAFYWVAKDAETWRNSAYDCVFKLDPAKGEYKSLTAYPMVELLGSKLLGDQKFDFKLDPARIDISEREIFIGKDLGSREIEVVPNMENMTVKAEGEWLNQTAPSWLDHKNLLTIYYDTLTVVQPPHDKSIKGILSLGGYLKLKYAYDKYDDFFEKWVHYETLIDDAIKSFKTDNNTTATQSLKSEDLGNGRLGIEMSYEYPYPDKDGYQNKYVSFELPNGYESETIENFKYIVKAKDAYWLDFADVTIEIASIPLTKKEQKTDSWGWDSGTMKFSGSLESGVKLTSVKYHIISWTGSEEKGETASDPTQNVEVTLSWGTDPDAIKRANK